MNSRLASRWFLFGSLALGLALIPISRAAVWLPAPPFDPPKPIILPTLRELVECMTLKFDGPKLEPLRLEGLLEQTEASVVNSSSDPATTSGMTPDLHGDFVDFVRRFEAVRAEKAGVPERIEHAVNLIHLGRHAAAVEALLAIEADNPGLYHTAANLGSAYERLGKLDEAVLWLARGLQRNAESHHGTEWLHIAILRAKLKLRDDATWLSRHNVLDGVGDRHPEEIVRAIDHQLGERLRFVEPADPIVCDLFYQAAIRVTGPDANRRRAHYLRESLRFGDWRKAEIVARSKT